MNRTFVLLLVSLLTLVASIGVSQTKKTAPKPGQSQTQLQKQLKEAEAKKNQIRSALRKTRAEATKVKKDIRELDHRLIVTGDRLDKTQNQLGNARTEQADLKSRLSTLEKQLAERERLLASRIRSSYTNGQVSYVSVLSGARSMNDLSSRGYVVQRILETDRKLMNDVRYMRNAVEAAKKRKDALVGRIAALERNLKVESAQYQSAKTEKGVALKVLRSQESTYLQQLREIEQESNAIASALRAMQRSSAGAARAATPWTGRFVKPVAGRTTSPYGNRLHPIAKVTKLHTGVDFGASHGTKIVAADDGVVIEASYRRGYGNTVIIDHGGGIATLYAHCSSLLVSAGQNVSQGQTIARVGSTGYSTGPHLHFEVRVNGEPVNPSRYGIR